MTQIYAAVDIRHNVDEVIFKNEIIPAGKPCILRGLVSDWNLTQIASGPKQDLAKFLVGEAASSPVNVFAGQSDIEGKYFYDETLKGFNFERLKMTFADFVSQLLAIDEGKGIYMGSEPMSQLMPNLAMTCPMPLAPAQTSPRIWIGNESVVSTHYDMDRNIACLISGERRFTLFSPDQTPNLYPGPIEHNMAGPQVSLPDPENPDLDKYPKFAEAMKQGLIADLTPGDGLYIPPLWWHHVRATGSFNVLVNFWWETVPEFSRHPMQPFVLSLLALRQLPEAERKAWRVLFDYFVFQTDGPPMEHLPDDVRGVLGDIDAKRAQQIWHYFISKMR